jgi:hypothetical protein
MRPLSSGTHTDKYITYVHMWIMLLFSLAVCLILRRDCDQSFAWVRVQALARARLGG